MKNLAEDFTHFGNQRFDFETGSDMPEKEFRVLNTSDKMTLRVLVPLAFASFVISVIF